jgi:hypothetical protein
VAIGAGFVTDVSGAFDVRRRDDSAAVKTCTRVEEDNRCGGNREQEQGNEDAFHRHYELDEDEAPFALGDAETRCDFGEKLLHMHM